MSVNKPTLVLSKSPLKKTHVIHSLKKSIYPEKSLHIESGPELVEIFMAQLSILKKHCFLSRNQHKYCNAVKENITANGHSLCRL